MGDSTQGSGHGHHVIVPIKTYFNILLWLLALTVLTVVVAPPVTGVDFGFLNAFIAFAIATAKATLVLAIFMGLKYDDKVNLVIILSGVFFLVVLFAFSIVDIYSRVGVESTL